MVEFTGAGTPLSPAGTAAAQGAVDVPPAALWAVLSVETSGCGYLPDRRPKILFERHIFSRLTRGQFDADDPDVSAPTPGGYGAAGANQYLRLQAAMQLDQEAALKSASWGLGQIMGENSSSAGFANVDDMVAAFVGSEDGQLLGMANFIAANGMDDALQQSDWATFARLYNGPNYAANNYDGHLQAFYQRYTSGSLPDLTIRAAQVLLTYKGYLIAIDGVEGPATTAAVKGFQQSIGVDANGTIDATLIQQLST